MNSQLDKYIDSRYDSLKCEPFLTQLAEFQNAGHILKLKCIEDPGRV